MIDLDLKNLEGFYKEHLYHHILPFWLDKGIDYEKGGYFTCFNNTGDELVSQDKFVWSQGRFVWVLSKLAEISTEKDFFLILASLGIEFLKRHCLLDNGNCAFLLSRDGRPKKYLPGKGYDISIYADCFVVLGFAKYAEVTGREAELNFALNLYDSIINRIENNRFGAEPYPVPEGYKAHGIPMIALNTSQTLAQALERHDHPRTQELQKKCEKFIKEIFKNFLHQGFILEMVGEDNKPVATLLGSYINPGHAIEDMGFILQYAKKNKNREFVDDAILVVKNSFEIGWDKEYGGIFQYVNLTGEQPVADSIDPGNQEMLRKLKENWDNKLWWPHIETLYTSLLCYQLTEMEVFLSIFRKVHDYTFRVFPDKICGEWIQIRDRQGRPVEKTVALPVKDPFHIPRGLIQIIELLKEMQLERENL